jgi:hypothetical protein
MKTLQEVLDNYKAYATPAFDRFGARLADFLNVEQVKLTGLEVKEEYVADWKVEKEWTRENILAQLKSDVFFGWEKACDGRGISSSLMYHVVMSWNKVLEEGLENWDADNYAMYGKPLFEATAEKYGWELPLCDCPYDEEEEE